MSLETELEILSGLLGTDVKTLFGSLGHRRYIAQTRNSVTPTTVNFAAWTDVPMTGIVDFMDGDYEVSGDGIKCITGGQVKITGSVSIFSAGQRVAPMIRAAVNGNEINPVKGKTGYIRAASGHNESTIIVPGMEYFAVPGDVITFQLMRESTLTTATTMEVGGCYMMLERWY